MKIVSFPAFLPVSINCYYLNVPFFILRFNNISNVNLHEKLSVILPNEPSY